MALRPGEENVATLFGDVHYYYGPPTAKPPHHRFDKGSYVYLFENAQERRARIEIANQPGTEDQDAFDGYLDNTRLCYSYKHTCIVNLTVGEAGPDEWHLPTYDPHNQTKYQYRLHSLDIYFRTQQDALQFVNGVRRVLAPAQCDILDEPGPPPRHAAHVDSVVQRLELAAIDDDDDTGSSADPAQLVTFVPMAYNPAAPAAPEPIRLREKTPPPEDGINPLQQTLAQDALTGGASSFPAPPTGVTAPTTPPQGFGATRAGPTSPGLPPQYANLVRANTAPVSPGLASPYAPVHVPGYPPVASPGLPQSELAIHNQFHVPEDGSQLKYKPKTEVRGRLEENAGRLERGVTGMLKRFEKRFG